jgi:hypothetical protein
MVYEEDCIEFFIEQSFMIGEDSAHPIVIRLTKMFSDPNIMNQICQDHFYHPEMRVRGNAGLYLGAISNLLCRQSDILGLISYARALLLNYNAIVSANFVRLFETRATLFVMSSAATVEERKTIADTNAELLLAGSQGNAEHIKVAELILMSRA